VGGAGDGGVGAVGAVVRVAVEAGGGGEAGVGWLNGGGDRDGFSHGGVAVVVAVAVVGGDAISISVAAPADRDWIDAGIIVVSVVPVSVVVRKVAHSAAGSVAGEGI